jgi:hypothetical protein
MLSGMASLRWRFMRPSTEDVVGKLRELAGVFAAFADANDRSRYDPYALSRAALFTSEADFLEAQGAPLSEGQITGLQTQLRYHIGSLLDYAFDERRWGRDACTANQAVIGISNELKTMLSAMSASARRSSS